MFPRCRDRSRRRLLATIATYLPTFALALAGAAAPALPQQTSQPLAATAPGRLHGVVFDSLLGKPLAGATVRLAEGGAISVTDDQGRYTLDSVPAGHHVVAFDHPDLDSLGLSALGAAVDLPPGADLTLDLATPSLARLAHGLCSGATLTGPDSGIVFGSVRDAATDSLLAGAAVEVSWLWAGPGEDGKLDVEQPVRTARTDTIGSYALCGLPTGEPLELQALAGRVASGTVEVVLGPRRLARRDVLVDALGNRAALAAAPPAASGAASDSGAAQPPAASGSAAVVGVVRGERGRPLEGAVITLAGTTASATTDHDGTFALRNLPAGTQMLLVRALGYTPTQRSVDLRPEHTVRVDVTLGTTTELEPVLVMGKVDALTKLSRTVHREFAARRRLSLGEAIAPEEMRRLQDVPLRAVLGRLQGAHIEIEKGGGFTLHFPKRRVVALDVTNTCLAYLFIDGVEQPFEFLQSIPTKDIAAIESYRYATQIPGKYKLGIRGGDCGALLVWTHRFWDR